MKKRVLLYLTVLSGALSLQSCVSNYVVAKPTVYKTDAKLATISPTKLNETRRELSGSAKINSALASIDAEAKADETEKTIKHNKTIDQVLNEAYSFLGTPYRYGGMTRSGIDCSAFVLSVFGNSLGMHLPRVAASQSEEGERVERSDLHKGDLVFFSHGGGRISHVGIVQDVTPDGGVKFIHAATSRGVMISSLSDSYWGPKFRFAKRIVKDDAEAPATFAHN